MAGNKKIPAVILKTPPKWREQHAVAREAAGGPPGRKRDESQLLAEIRLAVGARPDFLLTRVNTGVYAVPGKPGAAGGRVRSAPNGFPDLIGTQLRRIMYRHIVNSTFSTYEEDRWHYYGQAIAIETKAKRGEMSEAQLAWRAAFERVGGVYILARDVQEVYMVLGGDPEPWTRSRPLAEKVS